MSASTPNQPTTTPGPLSDELLAVTATWAKSQHRIVVLAAAFADSHEWVLAGARTAAAWLADVAGVEQSTAREWIRIGRQLPDLPASADAFDRGEISYSKVRTLTRLATPENEEELLDIARTVSAGELGRALAAWLNRNSDPDELAAHQQRQRSVRWRHEPDGMVTFTLKLPPLVAGMLISFLSAWVLRNKPEKTTADAFPTVAQQRADAIDSLLSEGGGGLQTEVVLHVRADGCTLDDGTPIAGSIVERVASESFLRALIHDAESRPLNASGRRRPTTRQKRVVKERDRVCRNCGRSDLLQYHHNPSYEETKRTNVEELELDCAPCHRQEHDE